MTTQEAITEVKALLDYEIQSGRLDNYTIHALEKLIKVAEQND